MVSNPFGLQLEAADDVHTLVVPSRNCERCKAYLLIQGETLNEHLLFDHNVRQRPPLTKRDGEVFDLQFCPDCKRRMECFSYSDTTWWRCRRCGYEWRLERMAAFDPKELEKRERKWKNRRDHYPKRRPRR